MYIPWFLAKLLIPGRLERNKTPVSDETAIPGGRTCFRLERFTSDVASLIYVAFSVASQLRFQFSFSGDKNRSGHKL